MGAEAEVLLVRRAAAALFAALALTTCQRAAPAAPVDPAAYDQFFLWPGVRPPPAVAHAKVVYILGGEIRRGGPVQLVDMRASVPHVQGSAVWLTVRAERLDWDVGTWRGVLAMLARWRVAGNQVQGLQIDFDAATAGLDGYNAFLKEVRRRLPPGTQLSITGLLDWSANGNSAALSALAGVIDEVVIQTYQARSTIPGYAAYFRHIDRLPMQHKIALVEGGEWSPPPALARDPRFAGYVVFLLRPAVLTPLAAADQAPRRP